MAIHFYCPLGHRLAVPDERAGKKGRCPVCQQKVYVPVADPQPSGRPKRAAEVIEVDSSPTFKPAAPTARRDALEDIAAMELGLEPKPDEDEATVPAPLQPLAKELAGAAAGRYAAAGSQADRTRDADVRVRAAPRG